MDMILLYLGQMQLGDVSDFRALHFWTAWSNYMSCMGLDI